MKINVPGPLKLVLKAALTIGALWFVFSKIPLREVVESARGLSPWPLIPALLFFILSKYLSAIRLNLFFFKTGIGISSRFNIKLYLLGMFYNLFLPGGIGGDGYKIFLLNRKSGVKGTRILWAVLADRIIGVLALAVLGVLLYYFTPLDAGIWQGFIWLLIPLGLGATWLATKKFLPQFTQVFGRSTLISLGVQFAQLGSALLILTSLNVQHDLESYLFLFLVSSIVAMLPITIGGIGSRELTFLLGAGMLGLHTGTAVALSLIFYLLSLVVSLSGLLYVLRPGELRIEKKEAAPVGIQEI